MNIDSHYYGSYFIARAAGFDKEDARKIAWAAQTVDQLLFNVLSQTVYKAFSENEKKTMPRVITLVHSNDLITDDGNWKSIGDKDYIDMTSEDNLYSVAYRDFLMFSWMPFHFLPDLPKKIKNVPKLRDNKRFKEHVKEMVSRLEKQVNTEYIEIRGDLMKYEDYFIEKYEKYYQEDYKLICKPSTDLCRNLIKDVQQVYSKGGGSLNKTLFRIGICMHVLADTWSHQDFCGNGDGFINAVYHNIGFDVKVKAVELANNIEKPFSSTYGGHGLVGAHPDTPNDTFEYTPPYSEEKKVANNKERFLKAFQQMYAALCFIRGKTTELDLTENRKDLQDVYINATGEFIVKKDTAFDKRENCSVTPDEFYSSEENFTRDETKTVYWACEQVFTNTKRTITKCSDCKEWKDMLKLLKVEELPDYNLEEENLLWLKEFLKPAEDHRDFIMKQLGYGYKISSVNEVIDMLLYGKTLGYYIEHAHNYYLDISKKFTLVNENGKTKWVQNEEIVNPDSNGSSMMASNDCDSSAKTNGSSQQVASNNSKTNISDFNIGDAYCNWDWGRV